jgi:hypothetical protein
MPTNEPRTVIVREVIAGTGALLVAAFAIPVVIGADRQAVRALVLAAITGVLAALLADWRSRAGVAVVAVVLFTAVVGVQSGIDPRHFTPLIVLACLLGTGYRQLSRGPGR